MKSCFDGLLNGAIAVQGSWPGSGRSALAGAVLFLAAGFGWEVQAAIAQPGSVMQIPVPAPQMRRAAVEGSGAEFVQNAQNAVTGEVLVGEPLAMPEATVPVGSWAGRAGVKEIALAEMPWIGGVGYAIAVAPQFQALVPAQYRVVVATPNEVHSEALKQVIPEAIALAGGKMMQAGAFADWRRANALRRALGAYGFTVEVQGL